MCWAWCCVSFVLVPKPPSGLETLVCPSQRETGRTSRNDAAITPQRDELQRGRGQIYKTNLSAHLFFSFLPPLHQSLTAWRSNPSSRKRLTDLEQPEVEDMTEGREEQQYQRKKKSFINVVYEKYTSTKNISLKFKAMILKFYNNLRLPEVWKCEAALGCCVQWPDPRRGSPAHFYFPARLISQTCTTVKRFENCWLYSSIKSLNVGSSRLSINR